MLSALAKVSRAKPSATRDILVFCRRVAERLTVELSVHVPVLPTFEVCCDQDSNIPFVLTYCASYEKMWVMLNFYYFSLYLQVLDRFFDLINLTGAFVRMHPVHLYLI